MFNKLNNLNLTFLFILIMSTLLSVSSSSWFIIWISMEINVMSFIPLMMKLNHMKTSESMTLYFLVQSLSSMNLLMIILMTNLKFFWFTYMYDNKIFLINLILLMKLGAAPFYFWFPKVMKELNWMTNYLLMTWQKIIPMNLIFYFMNKTVMYAAIIMSVILGSLKAFNQTNLKLMMAYSSINHIGWLLSTMTLNLFIWINYLLNYLMLNYILCKMFNMMKINFLLNIFNSPYPTQLKIIILINFFSLAGIPPFLGFLPKWMTLLTMIYANNFLITFILISTTLINLFFYLRLMIPNFILSFTHMKFSLLMMKFNTFKLNNLLIFSYMNMLILIFMMYIYQMI
uniref:NADH-ubiquinone oxidoreductase chain 2 n=1 Tax=Triaenodes qinglingensis TaxID=2904906 RepID=A0A9E8LPD1_9NEOP|nr:NADH dehydrogenase subunit 2 [Triaenodes qinglingensis]UZZ44429.1 NADH dehydrogenase subunit 2 [Triaenodes qinglingensis]